MTLKTLETLRKRADFLRLNRGRRSAVHGLVLQAALTPDAAAPLDDKAPMRLGLTVTKKIGNAVVRNRVRRRLRAAARAVLPVAGRAGYDYVLIARQGTLGRSFTDLKSDLERALKAVHSPKPGGKAGPRT
jgi:ribonuclease P protein component